MTYKPRIDRHTVEVKLTDAEASWLVYCLQYVAECYDDTRMPPTEARMKEIKAGRAVSDRIKKAVAKKWTETYEREIKKKV